MQFLRQAEVFIRSCDDDLMRRMFLESFLLHLRAFALALGSMGAAPVWMTESISGCDRLLLPLHDEGVADSRWEGDAMAVLDKMPAVERVWDGFVQALPPERREWFQ
jgi:hypothetical protein